MNLPPLLIPCTTPPFSEMLRLRGELVRCIRPEHYTQPIRAFVDAVKCIEDAARDGRQNILFVNGRRAEEQYPAALADASAAYARTLAELPGATTGPTAAVPSTSSTASSAKGPLVEGPGASVPRPMPVSLRDQFAEARAEVTAVHPSYGYLRPDQIGILRDVPPAERAKLLPSLRDHASVTSGSAPTGGLGGGSVGPTALPLPASPAVQVAAQGSPLPVPIRSTTDMAALDQADIAARALTGPSFTMGPPLGTAPALTGAPGSPHTGTPFQTAPFGTADLHTTVPATAAPVQSAYAAPPLPRSLRDQLPPAWLPVADTASATLPSTSDAANGSDLGPLVRDAATQISATLTNIEDAMSALQAAQDDLLRLGRILAGACGPTGATGSLPTSTAGVEPRT